MLSALRMFYDLETLTHTVCGSCVVLKETCENVSSILEGKHVCQNDPDADEDDLPLEEQAEFDSVLISSTSDVIATLASVLGSDFAQMFGSFLPLIAKYTVSAASFVDSCGPAASFRLRCISQSKNPAATGLLRLARSVK